MSPVFRHGRLRLYLLKLLDEAPRHGYEVIRLLQDRFMGVYAPSPGTIYPRLARLEEEGLVTHDENGGRKVYRITDKGREELRNRSGDLSDLEEEITASVRDIAREVTEDVRETVRNLREELTFAARDIYRPSHSGPGTQEDPARARDGGRARARSEWDIADQEAEEADQAARGQAAQPDAAPGGPSRADRDQARQQHHETRDRARAEGRQTREEARQGREEARRQRQEARRHEGHGTRDQGDWDQAGPGAGRRGRGRDWPPWADRAGWSGWPSGPAGWADPGTYRDLEQLARHFSRDLRDAAAAAQAVSEEAVGDLRSILDDAMDRIKAEVFGPAGPHRPPRPDTPPGPDTPPRPAGPPEPDTPPRPAGPPESDEASRPDTPPAPEPPPAPETPPAPGSPPTSAAN
jgi:DNA-binding PadR family transcriptional regulator